MEGLINIFDVIIVNPKNNGNIGPACGAMKTMGFTLLSIAGEENIIDNESKTMAVHAFDMLENTKNFRSIEEAVKGSSLIAGIITVI